MSRDAYAPCPCGSGKKFKFCCISLADSMEKVERHLENDQNRMALGVLERLQKKHPDNPWVLIDRGSVLLDEGEHAEAKATFEHLLEKHPDHVTARALHAVAALFAEGYEDSKPTIFSAIAECSRRRPDIISDLAMSIASLMFSAGRYLAARQFLVLAMRLAVDEETQQQIFLQLLEFERSRQVVYPLRSVHQLGEYTGPEERKKEADRASRLANLGCWDTAAEIFTRLGEDEPDNAVLWQNAGFCRAWTGDETEAADALHLAARLQEDHETAVELETIAQLLDLENSEERIRYQITEYRVESLSRLLSALSEQERFARDSLLPAEDGEQEPGRPDAMLHVLDRPLPAPSEVGELTIETVPNIIADIAVYDADPTIDQPALAFIKGVEGDAYEQARRLFEEAAGELAQREEPRAEEQYNGEMPASVAFLYWRWRFPEKTALGIKERLNHEKWRQVIGERWPNLPQEALQEKTPAEAAGDAELRVPLTAAVYVLDALCDRIDYTLDVEETCRRLQVQPLGPIAVTDDTPLSSCSAMQMFRLPVSELSDDQLKLTLNRALLLQHSGFLYRVLREAERRPDCLQEGGLGQLYEGLYEISRQRGRQDEALDWLRKGREYAETVERSFEKKVRWEMRELALRLANPSDPELRPLLERFHSSYCVKVPELKPHVLTMCAWAGVPVPWASGEEMTGPGAETGKVSAGGIWTPEGAAAEGGEKKIWLPGQ